MGDTTFKPVATGQVGFGKPTFIVPRGNYKGVRVVDSKGNTVDNFAPSPFQSTEGGNKFIGNKPAGSYPDGSQIEVQMADGSTKTFDVGTGNQHLTGTFSGDSQLSADGGSGGGTGPGGAPFGPSAVGDHAFVPAFLGGQFPSPALASFNPIQTAPYNFTDPMQFLNQYSPGVRNELAKNFTMSKEFALSNLDTELQGLYNYVPGAAALKRRETSVDNMVNQANRTAQLNATLPGVREALAAQTTRANTLAGGQLPSSLMDAQLALQSGSEAADSSFAGGFGANSAAADAARSGLNLDRRMQLMQFGEQLLGNNVRTRSDIELAPTEYSNAGQQISPVPEVGAGRQAQQFFQEANAQTVIPTSHAFDSTIQQNQFATSNEQRTREFNATGQFDESKFNATSTNQFALDKFQYLTGYAGAQAGASQLNANTNLELAQQAQYANIFRDFLNQSQLAGTIGSIGQLVGELKGIIDFARGVVGGGNQPNAPTSGGGTGGGMPGGGVSGGSSGGGGSIPSNAPFDTGSPSGTTGGIDTSGGDQVVPPEIPPGVDTTNPGTTVPVTDTGVDTSGGFAIDTSAPEVSNVSDNLGLSLTGPQAAAALQSAAATMASIGFHTTQNPGTVSAGVNINGQPQFVDKNLAMSTNGSVGSKFADQIKGIVQPMGVLQGEDATKFDTISTAASDPALRQNLNALVASGDQKGFVDTLLRKFGDTSTDVITKNPSSSSSSGVGSLVFSAASIYRNWARMSPAQRSLAVASIGISAFRTATGTNLARIPIIQQTANSPGLTVGQGLGLIQQGYNVYSMIHNWGNMNTVQRLIGGAQTATAIAQTARNMGFLGAGTSGTSVAVNAGQLANTGWSAAPALGNGTIVSATGSSAPAGYTVTRLSDGRYAATPTGTAASQTLQEVGGAVSFAAGAYQVYKGWGTGGSAGAENGLLGGSAMVAGLYAMGATNPYVLAGVMAVSVAGNMIHTGKNEEQNSRDAVRSFIKKKGLVDDSYNVTLPSGTKYDLGVDGHGGTHQWAHPELRAKGARDVLNSYESDYTNDLDYSTMMGGVSLMRILAGGKTKGIDQIGNQIGNAALADIGFGKDFTPQNFNKAMANLRATYAKSGVDSRESAYALANQAYTERRISAFDLVMAHQSADMVFNNDFNKARNLMAGRHRGIEIAGTITPEETVQIENSIKQNPPPPPPTPGKGGSFDRRRLANTTLGENSLGYAHE